VKSIIRGVLNIIHEAVATIALGSLVLLITPTLV
jgi:hypothetical protein